MPAITQPKGKQYIVRLDTFLAWKRFKREHPDATIKSHDPDRDVLTVEANGRRFTVASKGAEAE